MAIELNKDNLESSLNSGTLEASPASENTGTGNLAEMSKEEGTVSSSISVDEEIGVHKGSLNTLAAERMELVKMLQNVETIMQAHLKRLEELGVKIEQPRE